MSLEDQNPLDPGSDVSADVPKNPGLSYSREFLLSLSSLDICKKLPNGFDVSILSEFEDALLSTADRPRTHGSLPFLGYRRNEHSSSPPARGDSGNYSRGNYGSRWDSRSSGRSDRDSDSQSDRDSESGRRFDHQYRRSWQTPEHDGLLGSGSFPRPSGYAAGSSASKMRTNEQYQLSKSREPYHPPRPYKAVPHSRKDTDSYNDETFGLSESASEDKVEEERKRRASFELIRKEQQKALQEKQKMNMEKRNVSGNSELTELLENDEGAKEPFARSNEPEVSAASVLNNNVEKPSFAVQSPASRPVVPPGFYNNTQEKSSELKSLIFPSSSEVTKPASEESLLDVEVNPFQNGINVVGQPAETTQQTAHSDKFDKEHSQESLDVPFKKLSFKHQSSPISSHFDSYRNLKDPQITESNAEVLNEKTVGDPKGNESTSILEKIFGSTLSVHHTLSGSIEVDDIKPNDAQSHSSVQSSKFAQWFFEEEDNVSNNLSSARPNDLLSLIVTGDKANGNSDPLGISSGKEVPTVLTCEDLEQSMLSEYNTDGKHVQPFFNSQSNSGASPVQHREHVDDHASLHLLSMLHKSTESNASVGSGDDVKITSASPVSHKHDMDPKVEDNIQSSPNLGRPLTLETLFGTAFMKELQSVGAPVSAQTGPMGPAQADSQEPHGPLYQFPDNEKSSRVVNGIQRSGLDIRDHRNQTKQSRSENWLGFNDPQIEIVPSGGLETTLKHGGFEGMYRNLPEDNIMLSADAQNHQISTFMATDRPDYQIPYQNIQRQHSSPQLGIRPEPLNQAWGPFHQLESKSTHMSSPANFLGPDSVFNHNSPSDHQFPPNMIGPQFHHLNRGFDALHRHPVLHQMAGNHPHHMFPDFPPRGGLVSSHGSEARVVQEMNNIQGFPFRPPHMPNIHGAHPMPGPGDVNSGGNPPEAFQRLIAMQLRANSNQIPPFGRGHGPGGNEVGGFQYR